MKLATIQAFRDCCATVLQHLPGNTTERANARAYAEGGLKILQDPGDPDFEDAIRTQALYLRSNLGSWRGDHAKLVRRVLDDVADELK